jgi:hypothetical protein
MIALTRLPPNDLKFGRIIDAMLYNSNSESTAKSTGAMAFRLEKCSVQAVPHGALTAKRKKGVIDFSALVRHQGVWC